MSRKQWTAGIGGALAGVAVAAGAFVVAQSVTENDGSSPSPTSSSSSVSVDPSVDARALSRFTCPTDFYPAETLEMFAKSEGFCDPTSGPIVGIYTFGSVADRDQWEQVATSVAGSVRTGESHGAVWAVSGDNATAVRATAENLQ